MPGRFEARPKTEGDLDTGDQVRRWVGLYRAGSLSEYDLDNTLLAVLLSGDLDAAMRAVPADMAPRVRRLAAECDIPDQPQWFNRPLFEGRKPPDDWATYVSNVRRLRNWLVAHPDWPSDPTV